MTVGEVENDARNSNWNSCAPPNVLPDGEQATLDCDRPDGVLVDSATVVGHLEHDRPTRGLRRHGDRGARRLVSGNPLLRCLAAMVDGVDHQVLECVGDAVQHLLVELDILTDQVQAHVLAGGACDVADQPREGRDHTADRHHGKPHRAVANKGEPTPRVLYELAQLVSRTLHLIGHRHHLIHGGLDLAWQAHAVCGNRVAQRTQPSLLVDG